MANHAWVKTKKHMTPEKITNLLNELNDSHFKGGLVAEFTHRCNLSPPRNTPFWDIYYNLPNSKCYFYRACWLKTRQHFELRHGPGLEFGWWLEEVILNEIAFRFDGNLHDNATSRSWKPVPGNFPTFLDYLERTTPLEHDSLVRRAFMQRRARHAPPEHQPDLGEPIEIKFEVSA